jgi:hypothetical protein
VSDLLTEDEARELLIRAVHASGSATAYAKQAGCSGSLISRALSGQKPIGAKIATALGLIAVPRVTYEYLKANKQ